MLGGREITPEQADAKRLEYLTKHDYTIKTSYGTCEKKDGCTKYIVLTKHRDWKDQDRPFWIPIELAEDVIAELKEALEFYKENR